MANTTEAHWDESSPAITDARRAGAAEITALRKAVRQRMSKEHDTLAASSVGGEHKEGSAKVYAQAAAPTKRPDGTTDLDSDDQGRLWLDTDNGVLKYWDGNSWEDIETLLTRELDGFEKLINVAEADLALPYTETGLVGGTYLITIDGCVSDVSDNAPATLSVTVNGTTRNFYIPKAAGGTPPFSLSMFVTVTTTVSITATTNVGYLRAITGFRVA